MVKNRFIILFSILNSLLAASHLLPAHFEFFQQEMIFRSLARCVHGSIEFLSYSLLLLSGNLSSLGMFLVISILGFLGFLILQALWKEGIEGREIVLLLLLFNSAFGGVSIYAGEILVGSSTLYHCDLGTSELRQVISYPELGWYPGYHYFLLGPDASGESWIQISYTTLDRAVKQPCENIDSIFGELP
jgi:hypothetical protein